MHSKLSLNHQVTKDVVILGNRVPKGTLVMVPTVVGYEDRSTPIFAAPESMSSSSSLVSSVDSSDDENVAVHRSESLSSVRGDAPSRKVGFWASGSGLEFNPDRWLDEKGNFDLNAGPSLPFSSGQRGCFGKNLAVSDHGENRS